MTIALTAGRGWIKMSVLIKDMRLPDCCAVCELSDSDDDGIYCNVLEEFMRFAELPKGRRSDCPLTELICCKDCKHRVPDENGNARICNHPNNNAWNISDMHYCGYAERRGEE